MDVPLSATAFRKIVRVARSIFPSQSRPPSIYQMRRDHPTYFLGILLLLLVVVLWTASNFVTQELYQGGFHKPFLVTYLNTSAFALYLLPTIWKQWGLRLLNNDGTRGTRQDGYEPLGTGPDAEPGQITDEETPYSTTKHLLSPLTVKQTIDLAFTFCFLWFIANWSLNAGLDYTTVASATILSSMSGLFTLAIGRLFLVERLTIVKFLAVLTSFGGVVLVSLSDSSASDPKSQASLPLLGDFLALISAIAYALYVILLKVRIRVESRIDMQLFFGFVGLFNIIMCPILGLVLHVTGVEPFELPNSRQAAYAILINMFITWSSDYLYVLAMLRTTPLVVTVGLSLTIPLAVIGDALLGRPTRGLVLLGAFVVVASFVAVGLDDAKAHPVADDTDSLPTARSD